MNDTGNSLLLKRARSAMKKGRYDEAVEIFERGSSKLNKNWRAMWDFGWCYYKLEKFRKAGRWFDLAHAQSGDPICKWARGLVYIKNRKYKKAEQVLLESLRQKERFHTRIALALAYLAQEKIEEAEKTHLDGIKLGTSLTERYESYAAFLSDVGRAAEAERMHQEANKRRVIQ